MGKIIYDLCECGNKKCNFSVKCRQCRSKIQTEKTCTKCNTVKLVSEFGIRRGTRYRSHCRQCENITSKTIYSNDIPKAREKHKEFTSDWRTKNPEKTKISDIKTKIKKMGLENSMEIIQERLSNQLTCDICKEPERKNMRLSIDHCHTSIIFRGLLCNNCNTGLGFFKDNTELMKKAIEYLEKSKGS